MQCNEHVITCCYIHYIKLHTLGRLSHPFAGLFSPLTALFHAGNMLNTHEDLRSRPSTWMVSGFLPHIDPEIAKYSSTGGNSISVRNVELMAQCSECLFEGWNETYADPLPMEFADGKTRLTHVVAALSIADQQEADKLLGDPLSCHVCTVPDTHYLTPEVTFPVKTAPSVLKKVVDAAGGKFLPQPRLLIGRSPEGHRIWLGTQEQYRDARRSAGGVHLVYNPLYEIVHMDINQSVRSAHYMLLQCYTHYMHYMALHNLTQHYILLHILHTITLCYSDYITLHKITSCYIYYIQ